MIKRIFITGFFLTTLIYGCSTAPVKEQANPNECTKYACPMHPDHTSTIPAKCPECNTEMLPAAKKAGADSAKRDTTK